MAANTNRRQTEQSIETLLDEMGRLSAEDTLRLAEAWADEDEAARRRAWQRAKAAIERTQLTALLDRAREEVGRWMLAGPADYQGIGGLLGRQSEEVSLRHLAAPAVLDAVAGLLAVDQLVREDADVLLRPWRRAFSAQRTDDDLNEG